MNILMTIWAVVTACFLVLLAYRGQVTRYEGDQLFLSDINPNEREAQSKIVRIVNSLEPFVNIFGGAAAIATVTVVGIYTWNAWQTLVL